MAVNFPETFHVKRRRIIVSLYRGRSKSYIAITIAIAIVTYHAAVVVRSLLLPAGGPGYYGVL